MIRLKTPSEVARIRESGRVLAHALRLVEQMARPGVSTMELDRTADRFIEKQGGRAAFKGYRGFPACLCTSLNEQIVHGIPGGRVLQEGDLLKVDCGVVLDGWYADAAVTIPIGPVSDEATALIRATRDALEAGIGAVRAGARVSDVSAVVQQVVEGRGFRVVVDYTGHGIGRELHEDPKVPNFVSTRLVDHSPVLERGAVLAIEPMVNAGTHRTQLLDDGWTVVTKDRRLSAHFEHTVAVEQDGPVILTLP